MTSLSPRLGLVVPTTVDQFSTADIAANWNKIDAAPGTHICTSSTRPTWGASQTGRKILETNTGLEWRWDGTQFVRLTGTGILKKNDGNFAIGERTTDFSTASLTYVKVVSVTNVVVPDGMRPLEIVVTFQRGYGGTKNVLAAVFRSDTNASGPQLSYFHISGDAGETAGQGVSFVSTEKNGLAAGTYAFSFQIRSQSGGGTSVIQAGAVQPVTITVKEL